MKEKTISLITTFFFIATVITVSFSGCVTVPATCGNGMIDPGETCVNCPYDVGMCVTYGWIEHCDTFDDSIWGYTWNKPIQGTGDEAGTWIWDFPVHANKNVQCVRHDPVGYGTFKIRFKISPRVSGVNYSPFLYNGVTLNELDMIEIFGENKPPNSPAYQMSLSSYQYPSPPGSHDYEYWNNAFDWEDYNWHVFECIYTAEKVTIKMDGEVSHVSYEGLRYGDPHAPWIAIPPMRLMIYAGSNGFNEDQWRMNIDWIQYIPS